MRAAMLHRKRGALFRIDGDAFELNFPTQRNTLDQWIDRFVKLHVKARIACE
jgi:hypothetical protein